MTTNPTPSELRAMSEAEVTQADRDAASAALYGIKVIMSDGPTSYVHMPYLYVPTLENVAQAFARHRIASTGHLIHSDEARERAAYHLGQADALIGYAQRLEANPVRAVGDLDARAQEMKGLADASALIASSLSAAGSRAFAKLPVDLQFSAERCEAIRALAKLSGEHLKEPSEPATPLTPPA